MKISRQFLLVLLIFAGSTLPAFSQQPQVPSTILYICEDLLQSTHGCVFPYQVKGQKVDAPDGDYFLIKKGGEVRGDIFFGRIYKKFLNPDEKIHLSVFLRQVDGSSIYGAPVTQHIITIKNRVVQVVQ